MRVTADLYGAGPVRIVPNRPSLNEPRLLPHETAPAQDTAIEEDPGRVEPGHSRDSGPAA